MSGQSKKLSVVATIVLAVLGSSVTAANADPLFTFAPRVDYKTGDEPGAVVATDLNGDGRPDLVTADRYEQALSIFLGTGGGAFGPRVRWYLGEQPTALAAADFDADGHADLAVVTYEGSVLVLHGNGSGTFAAPVSTSVSPYAEGMAAGDLNADGHADLVLSRPTGITVLLAGPTGSFGTATDLASGGYSRSVVLQDLDGNGTLDIAVTSFGSSDGIAWVFFGRGDGTFTQLVLHGTPGSRIDIAAGDFDGDSHPNLIVANYSTSGIADVPWRTEPTAGFRPATETTALSPTLFGLALADLDGDGRDDLATTAPAQQSLVLYRQQTQWETTPTALTTGEWPVKVYAADLDGDHRPDLITVNRTGKSLSVFLNRT